MTVTTKFDVDSLATMKYDRGTDDMFQVLEIKEVLAQICYGGVQIFYDCRTIVGRKEYKGFKKEGDFQWLVGHSLSKEDSKTGWKRYREDELIAAPQEHIDILKKAQ